MGGLWSLKRAKFDPAINLIYIYIQREEKERKIIQGKDRCHMLSLGVIVLRKVIEWSVYFLVSGKM